MARRATSDNEQLRLAALDAYQILDTDYDEAFDRYTRVAATLVGTPIAAISFVDADRQWFKSVYGMTLRQTAREHAFCAHTILGSLPLVVEDALQDPRFANNPLVIGEPWVRFYAGAPLLTPAGLSVGSLCTIDTRPRSISLEQSRGLADLADAIVTTLELYKTMREMKQLALTDALTGLANRVQFFRFLKASIAPLLRHGRPLSLLYLDCDNFKQLNDVSGHDEGDVMLRALAATLHHAVRSTDLPARLGGDEFAVILPDTGARTAMTVARRILQRTRELMTRHRWPMTMSVGLVTFLTPPSTADEALAAADQAMYCAKTNGKDRVHAVVINDRATLRVIEPSVLSANA